MGKQTFGYIEKEKTTKYITLKFNLINEEEQKIFEELNSVTSDYRVKKLIEIIHNYGNRPGKLTDHEIKLFSVIELMVNNFKSNIVSPQQIYYSQPQQNISQEIQHPPKKIYKEKIEEIPSRKIGGFMSDDVDLSSISINNDNSPIKEKVDYDKILDEIGEDKFN